MVLLYECDGAVIMYECDAAVVLVSTNRTEQVIQVMYFVCFSSASTCSGKTTAVGTPYEHIYNLYGKCTHAVRYAVYSV